MDLQTQIDELKVSNQRFKQQLRPRPRFDETLEGKRILREADQEMIHNVLSIFIVAVVLTPLGFVALWMKPYHCVLFVGNNTLQCQLFEVLLCLLFMPMTGILVIGSMVVCFEFCPIK